MFFSSALPPPCSRTGFTKSVVIIEGDHSHPSIVPCRRLGAIVLLGPPSDAKMLLAANLPRASTILALFATEQECMRISDDGPATGQAVMLRDQVLTREIVSNMTVVLALADYTIVAVGNSA